jgi:hypothetical protein
MHIHARRALNEFGKSAEATKLKELQKKTEKEATKLKELQKKRQKLDKNAEKAEQQALWYFHNVTDGYDWAKYCEKGRAFEKGVSIFAEMTEDRENRFGAVHDCGEARCLQCSRDPFARNAAASSTH